MEEAAELSDYLPLSFTSPKEQEYVAFLWDAFESNYTHGKYQFAFLAYHMLTMSFVYFNIWQIKKTEPQNFEVSPIGFHKNVEKDLIAATSPLVFSRVNERTILRFLKLLSCDSAKIGTYAKLVDERNETTHPNGNIFFSTQAALDTKITEVLRVVHERSRPIRNPSLRLLLKYKGVAGGGTAKAAVLKIEDRPSTTLLIRRPGMTVRIPLPPTHRTMTKAALSFSSRRRSFNVDITTPNTQASNKASATLT